MVNILRLTVAYLNATIKVKPKTQNRRLDPTGLAKPGETRGLTGTGPGLTRQDSVGRVFGRFWNRTNPFLRSKPGPLAGYPDPLLTLINTPPHLLRHPQGLCEKVWFWLEKHLTRVRRYDTTWQSRSRKSRKERVRSKDGNDRVCNLLYHKMI
jgi:hypothetical protein